MNYLNEALRKIEEQQAKLKENTAPWMVGEQLKDICRNEPKSAELIAQDLAVPEMSLVEAEKKIKAYSDKHKTGNFGCVPPNKAEEILRKFYGLDKAGAPQKETPTTAPVEAAPTGGVCVNLADFL